LSSNSNPDQKVLFRFLIRSGKLPCLLHFFIFHIIAQKNRKNMSTTASTPSPSNYPGGCSCKKTACRTLRCGCKKRGLDCLGECRCLDCKNRY